MLPGEVLPRVDLYVLLEQLQMKVAICEDLIVCKCRVSTSVYRPIAEVILEI